MAGRIGRPHGLDGSFYAVDADVRLLQIGAAVDVGGTPMEVVARKGTDARPILRLTLTVDREAVEALRGKPILVERQAAPALGSGEYWAADLVGCEVVDGERVLGRVERMLNYPSCDVLVVGELLVPLVRDAIRAIDVDGGRIDVDARFLGIDEDRGH